jgi:hypothetical protein
VLLLKQRESLCNITARCLFDNAENNVQVVLQHAGESLP